MVRIMPRPSESFRTYLNTHMYMNQSKHGKAHPVTVTATNQEGVSSIYNSPGSCMIILRTRYFSSLFCLVHFLSHSLESVWGEKTEEKNLPPESKGE